MCSDKQANIIFGSGCAEKVGNIASSKRTDIANRFIGDKQAWFLYKSTGERDTLWFATRELRGFVVLFAFQPHLFQQFSRMRSTLTKRASRVSASHQARFRPEQPQSLNPWKVVRIHDTNVAAIGLNRVFSKQLVVKRIGDLAL